MASVKQAFGTETSFTITFNSLASSASAGRSSVYVDNSSNLYEDALVIVTVDMPGSGTPANDKAVHIYAYGSNDASVFSDGVAGTDSAFTHTVPANLPLIGSVNTPASAVVYRGGPFSVARAFGGVLPKYWGIVIRNYCGLTLDSSGNAAKFLPVYRTVA